jgi:predicted AlkP superfamily pyrophosphatase or phosphodiesterase
MPRLREWLSAAEQAPLAAGFPAVTCPVQVGMTTGERPAVHGVVANGFYWRDRCEVEMWTAWNECIQAPQIWDRLRRRNPAIRSAVWFPLLSKGCGAEYVCTPAPIHNPDGSESLWCYTKPTPLYGQLRDRLGHFPLKHFWGPLASIDSTAWIVDSAVVAAEEFRPDFFYIYLPHLDYAAQKSGPDSAQAMSALEELDQAMGRLFAGFGAAYAEDDLVWIVAGEYAIVPVRHVLYPNRMLRDAKLLNVRASDAGEVIDFESSSAWALADHQFSHIFVRGRDASVIRRVEELFASAEGVDEVLTAGGLARYEIAHERSGDVVIVSAPDSWQAYYYWLEDRAAPEFARTVDIHRKPGYDPAELFFDPTTRGIPLDASLVRGSHGAPARDASQWSVLACSRAGVLGDSGKTLWSETDVADLVLGLFGMS